MLQIEEYEKVLKFVSLIQNNDEDYFDTILDSLKSVFDYINLSLFINDHSIPLTAASQKENNIIKGKSSFERMEFITDEGIQHRSLISIEEIKSYAHYQGNEYYTNFVEKSSFYHTIFIPLKWKANVIGVIGIHKTIEEGDFSSNEKLVLETLSSFISANLNRNMEHNQLKLNQSLLNQSMQCLPIGVVILNYQFAIVYTNEIALEYCPDIESNQSHLVKRIKDMIITKEQSENRIFSDGLQLNFNALRVTITPWAQKAADSKRYQYLIYLFPQTPQKENPLKKACVDFGLSKRESEIFDLISKGYSNNEIACKLFLSINTVKSHLNNIFNKLGVNNRTSAIHKISRYS